MNNSSILDMTPRRIKKFLTEITERGGECFASTSPYELARFKTKFGVGIIYCGKKGISINPQAHAAIDHISTKAKGSLAPVVTTNRSKPAGAVLAIMARDGETCFFCGLDLGNDVTVEHLVSKTHGGPNHIANTFLAHTFCNASAGHMSAPEKVALAISNRMEGLS